MPRVKRPKKTKSYNVLIGFDVPEGRWEIGDPLQDGDIAPEHIKELLEQKAIEVNDR